MFPPIGRSNSWHRGWLPKTGDLAPAKPHQRWHSQRQTAQEREQPKFSSNHPSRTNMKSQNYGTKVASYCSTVDYKCRYAPLHGLSKSIESRFYGLEVSLDFRPARLPRLMKVTEDAAFENMGLHRPHIVFLRRAHVCPRPE